MRALNPDAFKRLAHRSLNEIGIGLQGAIDLHLQVLTSFTPEVHLRLPSEHRRTSTRSHLFDTDTETQVRCDWSCMVLPVDP